MKYTLRLRPVTIGKRQLKTRCLPPNPNARMHFMERALWKNAFKEQLGWLIKGANIPKAQFIHVKVINRACHTMDDDNLYGASKCLFDTFTARWGVGIVPDDTQDHMQQSVENVKVDHLSDERVLIEIDVP